MNCIGFESTKKICDAEKIMNDELKKNYFKGGLSIFSFIWFGHATMQQICQVLTLTRKLIWVFFLEFFDIIYWNCLVAYLLTFFCNNLLFLIIY